MKIDQLLVLLVLTIALWGCSSTPAGPYGYTASYFEARSLCDDAGPADNQQIERFMQFYNQLSNAPVKQHIADIYAPDIYFNDTLVTLTSRDSLASHLQATADNLERMSVTLLDVLQPMTSKGHEAAPQSQAIYLLWEMEAQFSLLGKKRLSHTLGISQLCFNDQGLVIFHQDFWDSSQGLDQHLPLLGPPTRWLRQHSTPH